MQNKKHILCDGYDDEDRPFWLTRGGIKQYSDEDFSNAIYNLINKHAKNNRQNKRNSK